MSDWDLINGFITYLWNLRFNFSKDDESYHELVCKCNEFRDELIRRLRQKN